VRQTSFWKPLAIAFIAAMAVGGVVALMTDLGSWYQSLQRPQWQPPNWIIGRIWIAIFVLSALSAATAWKRAKTEGDRVTIVLLFAANAFFNILLTFLFFQLQRPDWALTDIAPLWCSILILIFGLGRYSRLSSLLLVPYLVWITFAAVLDHEIIRLNPLT
jgi:translocator protein